MVKEKKLEDICKYSYKDMMPIGDIEEEMIFCQREKDCPHHVKYDDVLLCNVEGKIDTETKAGLLVDDATEYLNQGDAISAIEKYITASKLSEYSVPKNSIENLVGTSLDYFRIENFIMQLGLAGKNALDYLKQKKKENLIEITVNEDSKKYFELVSIKAKVGEKKKFTGKEYVELYKKIAKEMALQHACEDDVNFREWNKRYELAAQILAKLNGEN